MVGGGPLSFRNLTLLEYQLPTTVVCTESNHNATRIGPRLTLHIAKVADGEPHLFMNFPTHSFFKCFPSLNEPCNEAEEWSREVFCTYKQYAVSTTNQHDYRHDRCRPHFIAATGTKLRNRRVHLHRCPADTAIVCVDIPVEDFTTFAREAIEPRRKQTICGTKGAQLIALADAVTHECCRAYNVAVRHLYIMHSCLVWKLNR